MRTAQVIVEAVSMADVEPTVFYAALLHLLYSALVGAEGEETHMGEFITSVSEFAVMMAAKRDEVPKA